MLPTSSSLLVTQAGVLRGALVRKTALVIAVGFVAVLGACGGGGGGGSASNSSVLPNTMAGTAAVGYPIVGGTVTAACSAGSPLTISPTNAQGAWSVTLSGQTFPCALRVSGGTVNGASNLTSYHAIAVSAGRVNLTPFTDLIVANVLGAANPGGWFNNIASSPVTLAVTTQSQLDASLTKLRAAMPLLTSLATTNPTSDAFSAVAGDKMDDMLEALRNAMNGSGVSHVTLLANAAVPAFTAPGEAFGTSLAWAFRNTSTGGNSYQASSMVSTVPVASYTGGSEEEAAFDLLNAQRNNCGFGKLGQHTMIDLAAAAHASWQLTNWIAGHYEDGINYPNGFTGYDATARIAFQGLTINGFDFYVWQLNSNKVGFGTTGMRRLLSGPFHLRGMVNGTRVIGISVKNNIENASPSAATLLQINTGYQTSKQLQDSSVILTYPCQGTTGVNYRLTAETPNPVPGRNLSTNPLGHPVLIKVRDGNTLAITSATMRNTTTQAMVALRSVATTKADDTNGLFGASEAYVIPDAALSQNTSYEVVIVGTNSSVPFSKTFTFTTGTGD